MRINKITTDSNGFKLVSATMLLYPDARDGINYFANYKEGILRLFTGLDYITYPIPTWREALTFIRRAGNWWEFRPRIAIPVRCAGMKKQYYLVFNDVFGIDKVYEYWGKGIMNHLDQNPHLAYVDTHKPDHRYLVDRINAANKTDY